MLLRNKRIHRQRYREYELVSSFANRSSHFSYGVVNSFSPVSTTNTASSLEAEPASIFIRLEGKGTTSCRTFYGAVKDGVDLFFSFCKVSSLSLRLRYSRNSSSRIRRFLPLYLRRL